MFEIEEFRLWLIDRFEPDELLLYLNVNTEDILEAFPEEWEDNEALIRKFGYDGEIERDEDEEEE